MDKKKKKTLFMFEVFFMVIYKPKQHTKEISYELFRKGNKSCN